ncbi:MAG: GNAT family N-acetyltransferase [Nitratireductor sp.]|nr:GNAT family N-acetyltransferase [Nitratireductor sp.]
MRDAYRPRLIAEVVRLHADYYAKHWGFGLPFEAKVALELADFLLGFREGRDFMRNVWLDDARLKGTVSLQAPDDEDGLAHLRWFIVDEAYAGEGLGGQLIDAAISHARSNGFAGVYLTTFAGLEAARKLYERSGFQLVTESQVDQWSGGVREQRFELRF